MITPQQLKHFRESLFMSRYELSCVIHLSTRTIEAMEKGKRSITPETNTLILEAFWKRAEHLQKTISQMKLKIVGVEYYNSMQK